MEKLFQGILDPSYHPETNHLPLFSLFEVACKAVLDFGVLHMDILLVHYLHRCISGAKMR